jgi:hypothetical protein
MARDVAFLTSASQLSQVASEPLTGITPDLDESDMLVVGYPYGQYKQLSYPVEFHSNPREKLELILAAAPSILDKFRQRRSPDPTEEVLVMRGLILPGHSGAPIVNPQRRVVGVALGGLAGGLTQINWMVGFADIRWEDASELTAEIQALRAMDLTELFASPIDPTAGTPEPSGVRISGRVIYNGEPATKYSRANAVIQLMDVEDRRDVPIDVHYDSQTGRFTLKNVPSGKYQPFVRLEAGYPFHRESGGDYFGRISGMNSPIVVAPHDESIDMDLKVVNVIHLTKPVDNQEQRTLTGDEPETLYRTFYYPSADRFEWDPVPGAVNYELWFALMDGNSGQRKDFKSHTVSSTAFSPRLEVTSGNDYYMFTMTALNSTNEKVGFYQQYYRNGTGGWFNFKVAASTHSSEQPIRMQPIDPGAIRIGGVANTVYKAPFSDWPRGQNEYGQVGEVSGSYVMQARSNTWIGPGQKLPITTLQRDFVLDMVFRVLEGSNIGLNLTISGAGSDYAQLSFYFSKWQSGASTFSISDQWVRQNFYVNTTSQITDREQIPANIGRVDLGEQNRLTVQREGDTVGLYLNGSVLKTFTVSVFPVRQIGIGLAFPSKVAIESIEARVP